MAELIYLTPEGEEQRVRLLQSRPLRIGREPGNDLILRDPKTSRSHAEIRFERGFFVLHDLDSANGTWIDGQRVRAAPLRDGMEILIGRVPLRFSDEVVETAATIAAPLGIGISPPSDARGEAESPEPVRTAAAPVARPAPPALHAPTPAPEVEAPVRRRTMPSHPQRDSTSFDGRRLFIEEVDSDGEMLACRNEVDQPVAFFRSARSAVVAVASLVVTMLVIAGIVVTAFLLYEWQPGIAALALLITISFGFLITTTIPRRTIPAYRDADGATLLFVARQQRGPSTPILRFNLRDADGAVVAVIEQTTFPPRPRRVWHASDADGMRDLMTAREDSLVRSWIGRVTGASIRALRTTYVFETEGRRVARLERSRGRAGHLLLEVENDQADRRLLLAMSLVIANVEG